MQQIAIFLLLYLRRFIFLGLNENSSKSTEINHTTMEKYKVYSKSWNLWTFRVRNRTFWKEKTATFSRSLRSRSFRYFIKIQRKCKFNDIKSGNALKIWKSSKLFINLFRTVSIFQRKHRIFYVLRFKHYSVFNTKSITSQILT